MPVFKEEEQIMTKRQEATEQFKPLSAVATSITTMGINEDGEFFQETNDIAADHTDLVETPDEPRLTSLPNSPTSS